MWAYCAVLRLYTSGMLKTDSFKNQFLFSFLMRNILFYKYVPIEQIEQFREEQYALCESLGLLGKVLVAEEGINGCLSGSVSDTQKYMDAMHADERFSDLVFKMGESKEHTFRKLFVKIRKEIITSKFGVDATEAAPYIEPKELKKKLDAGNDVVMIDARNTYETEEGMFEGAIDPKLDIFTQAKEIPEKFAHLKGREIVTYCTGGIRCEKFSGLLKKHGFDVKQLHGGILNYGKECGSTHWKGKCFVFDRRGSVHIDPAEQDGELSAVVKEKLAKADPFGVREYVRVGKVSNYYKKAGVVEVVSQEPIAVGMKVKIVGSNGVKSGMVTEIQEHDDCVTLPFGRVRENDIVYVKA